MGWGFLLYIVLWIVLPRGEGTGPASTTGVWRGRVSPAVWIAEERFARGQISAEELEQIRQDLTRGPECSGGGRTPDGSSGS